MSGMSLLMGHQPAAPARATATAARKSSAPVALLFSAAEPPVPATLPRPDYVYHFTTRKSWKQIEASGGLKPKRFGDPGTFVLSWDNLTRDWTRPTRHLGSSLQSFMIDMRTAGLADPDNEILLLRIKVAPNDKLWARDISPIFNRLDLDGWFGSLRPLQDFRPAADTIPELIIANPDTGIIPLSRVDVFRRIPVSTIPPEISRKKIDPAVVLQHVLNPDLGTIPVAADARPMRFRSTFLLGILKNPLNTVKHFYAKFRS